VAFTGPGQDPGRGATRILRPRGGPVAWAAARSRRNPPSAGAKAVVVFFVSARQWGRGPAQGRDKMHEGARTSPMARWLGAGALLLTSCRWMEPEKKKKSGPGRYRQRHRQNHKKGLDRAPVASGGGTVFTRPPAAPHADYAGDGKNSRDG